MTKFFQFMLAFLTFAGEAVAQHNCPPILSVWHNNQVVPANGAPFTPKVTLSVTPSATCLDHNRYQFNEAEITLARGKHSLLPTLRVRTSDVDLATLASSVQPGDHIHVFVLYKNLYVVAADGKSHPYPRPEFSAEQQSGLQANLVTEATKGIGFNWLLR